MDTSFGPQSSSDLDDTIPEIKYAELLPLLKPCSVAIPHHEQDRAIQNLIVEAKLRYAKEKSDAIANTSCRNLVALPAANCDSSPAAKRKHNNISDKFYRNQGRGPSLVECPFDGCTVKFFDNQFYRSQHLKVHQEDNRVQRSSFEDDSSDEESSLPSYENLSTDEESVVRSSKPKNNPGRIQCTFPKCQITFGEKSSLNRHLKRHSMKVAKPFPCDQCPKTFLIKPSLTRHKKDFHREGRLICDDCGKNFISHRGLELHQRTVHSNERPFECCLCESSYKRNNGLLEHYRTFHNVH